MAKNNRLYFILSQWLPAGLFKRIERLILQAGFFTIHPRKYAGFMLLFCMAAAGSAGIVTGYFYPESLLYSILAAIGTFIAVAMLFYTVLFLSAENRAAACEENLPEALRIIAANIRAGMTVENAVWTVSKPEFGVFGEEIKRMSVGVYAGKPITVGLVELGERVDSKILQRAVNLLAEGIQLGGEIANLLDEVADSIKQTKALRKEIRNATISYALFIIFSAIIVAPMLFSVSVYYSETNERMLSKQQSIDTSKLGKTPGAMSGGSALSGLSFQKISSQITSNDIRLFAIAAIAVTAFFSALTIGLIQHGKASWGIKLIPVFVPLALGIFFTIHWVMQGAFAGITK